MSSYEESIKCMIQNAFGMDSKKVNLHNKFNVSEYSAILNITNPVYLCEEGKYSYYASDLAVVFKNMQCTEELTKSFVTYCKENKDISLFPVLQTTNSKLFAKLIYKLQDSESTGSISDQVVRSYIDQRVREHRMYKFLDISTRFIDVAFF